MNNETDIVNEFEDQLGGCIRDTIREIFRKYDITPAELCEIVNGNMLYEPEWVRELEE